MNLDCALHAGDPQFPAGAPSKLRLVLSPHGQDGALQIRQDGRLYAGLFDGDASEHFMLPAQRYAYLHVVCDTPVAAEPRHNGVAQLYDDYW
ncbi:hypothetical protein KM188_09385 [Mycetohabitans sp. B4]|nr:hypothetical protein [Mycetohabitans sp. B4]